MRSPSLEQEKIRFLSKFGYTKGDPRAAQNTLKDAIKSSTQHNPLYSASTSSVVRHEICIYWKRLLNEIALAYVGGRTEAQYLRDVERLKAAMNEKWAGCFLAEDDCGRKYEALFRFSHAQKSLSLTLKHYWCHGLIPMPPQCPVDNIVLTRAARAVGLAPSKVDLRWVWVNNREDHQVKIDLLKRAAALHEGKPKLAEWELRVFNG